jgi:hypothetical protein
MKNIKIYKIFLIILFLVLILCILWFFFILFFELNFMINKKKFLLPIIITIISFIISFISINYFPFYKKKNKKESFKKQDCIRDYYLYQQLLNPPELNN